MGVLRGSGVGRLFATAAAVALLISGLSTPSGAAVDKGVVSGALRIYGATFDAPRSGWPTAGRVVFKPKHGTARAIKVGKTGQFTVELKPGTYTVFGGPPAWDNDCVVNGGKPFKLGVGQRLKVVASCVEI
jgi:hypothetical protein